MTASRATVRRTVLLWIMLELLAALQVRSPMGGILLVSWLRAVAMPLERAGEHLGNLAIDLGLGTRNLQRVIAENRRMRLENEALRARVLLLSEDLAALREAHGLAGLGFGLEDGSVVARCTYRDLSAGTMEVRTAEPLALPRDTPAVTANGLVGRVVRSERRRHWIELVTNAAAAVAVQTEDGQVRGLAMGGGTEEIRVAYVPRQAQVVRGTQFYTSGADGVYPPGIPAVTVVRVRESEAAFLEVGAIPAARLAVTRVVLLLPAWSPVDSGDSK
ncbi:MAG: rod shape-determining protein MreC [Acidobacteriota bacterium]